MDKKEQSKEISRYLEKILDNEENYDRNRAIPLIQETRLKFPPTKFELTSVVVSPVLITQVTDEVVKAIYKLNLVDYLVDMLT